MSWVWRITAGLLLTWALYLYFGDPELTLTYNADDKVTIECPSLADQAFGGDGSLDTSGTVIRYEVVSGTKPEGSEGQGPYEIHRQLNDKCDRTMTGRAGGIGLLAVPISVFGVLGLRRVGAAGETARP